MTQVIRSADCGNSPKNTAVEDIAIALETGDVDFLAGVIDPGATWERPGATEAGAEAILAQVRSLDSPSVVTIEHAISHGKIGAVSGSVGQGTGRRRFCHVIEFTSVKCTRFRRIDSYGA